MYDKANTVKMPIVGSGWRVHGFSMHSSFNFSVV